MAGGLDRDWFFDRLKSRGQSLRKLAKYMDLDPSAVSRIVSGARSIKASEQDQIAAFLGVPASEVSAHRSGGSMSGSTSYGGLGEMKQSDFAQTSSPAVATKGDGKVNKLGRHPAFGVWKGKVTLLPDYDYTQPADPDWGKVYEE